MIQVFAAPAVSWRGIFSVHTWVAVKPTGAPRFTRYEVLGFGIADGAPQVRIDRMGLDNHWFGAWPEILLDRGGAGVDESIGQVCAAVANYPYPNTYRPWPGPNSNTFLVHIARRSPSWRSASLRVRSVRISCQAAACSPRHPADLGFRYRFMGSSVSCSPPAKVLR